jgi:DNA helicase-2/ATP-dependent DNA helicase PcrA
MTAHHAKGMEFPYVAIAFASDERWLGKRTDELSLLIEKEDDEHDIRRLFYVALTRAKKEVLITYSLLNDDARAQTPLRFLADLTISS